MKNPKHKIIAIEYKKDATIEIDLFTFISNALKKMDMMLLFLSKKNPGVLNQYIDSFIDLLSYSIEPISYSILKKEEMSSGLKYLNNDRLVDVLTDAVLTLLHIPKELKEESKFKQYKILTDKSLKARLHILYYMAKTVEIFSDRNEAVQFCKDFVDFTTERRDFDKTEKIEELFFEKDSFEGEFKNSFDFVSFILDEARVGAKIKRCRWAEVIREVADEEYAYAITCHYDFLAAKKMNPDFELTRTKTISEGCDFCDFIWHDKSKTGEIQHEESEFWKNL